MAAVTRVAGYANDLPPDAHLVVIAPTASADPLEQVSELREVAPHATLVVALRRPTLSDVMRMLSKSADAIVDLDASDASLAHGVHAAGLDGSYVPRELQAAVAAAIGRRRRDEPLQRARLTSLTSKEREVLELLVAGSNRASIAAYLDEPMSRVRIHIDRVKAKLGVSSQRDAVAMLLYYLNRSA